MEREMHADIVIIGGSLGGVAGALSAARAGKRVILTEDTHWIGGQLTNQAVPPDEHVWIEQFGCTASYRELRNRIRAYYHRNFPVTGEAAANKRLNPGNGHVGKLCHEPRAALAVLTDMLAPYVHSGRVIILTRTKAVEAEISGDFILSARVRNLDNGDGCALTGSCFLDATECGDLLPLTNTEYVTGSEAQKDTGELHALPGEADPLDMQAVTWCFAMDYTEGEDYTIEKPREYDFWKSYRADFWPVRLLDWAIVDPATLAKRNMTLFPPESGNSLWGYRQILDQQNFLPGTFESSITLVNWPQNDYWLGPIYEVGEEEAKKHREGARQLSLSLLYWMQTEAPGPGGRQGYPGLRLRGDVTGTGHGLAMQPYIREARRIKAEFTILEQHVGHEMREGKKAEQFRDSVGIGAYRIDLHPGTGGRTYVDIPSLPFQIPLGSLIPQRVNNLLAACKNIGTTHITNGCYRLHPVEWNIGEAAGCAAAYCVNNRITPRELRNNQSHLEAFQRLLAKEGFQLQWPDASG